MVEEPEMNPRVALAWRKRELLRDSESHRQRLGQTWDATVDRGGWLDRGFQFYRAYRQYARYLWPVAGAFFWGRRNLRKLPAGQAQRAGRPSWIHRLAEWLKPFTRPR